MLEVTVDYIYQLRYPFVQNGYSTKNTFENYSIFLAFFIKRGEYFCNFSIEGMI